jgi:Ca-activated chloride channel family protein
MTDGLPTVGETNAEKIIANIRAEKTADVRIFPFGVGYDVNTVLLDKLGAENGGMSDYVQPKEDIEIKVSNFFTRVSSPVLSGIELDFGRIETDLLYPRKLTDIFRGMQTTVVGRYKNEADLRDAVITLRGRSGSDVRSFTYRDLDFPARTDDNEFLPRLWASRRAGWLIEQIRINGEKKELRDEVVDLGTRFGIVTPYTSFLATDGTYNAAAPQDAVARRELQSLAARKMVRVDGAEAVAQSVQQNTMQMNTQVASGRGKDAKEEILIRNSSANQFVGTKNFFNRSNVWIDAEFRPEAKLPETNVRFGSDEYFSLAQRERGLAQYLALGEQVVVVWNRKVYRVVQ